MSWGMDEDADDLDEEAEEDTSEPEETTKEEETSDDLGGWGDDVGSIDEADDDADDEEPDEDDSEQSFSERFAEAVENENVESITVSTLEDNYKEIDDGVLISKAGKMDTRSSAQDIYERRLKQVRDDLDDDSKDEEVEDETDDESIEEVDQDDLDELGVDNLADESDGDTSDDTEETETTDVSSLDDETGSIDEVDVGAVAPNAMNTNEAAEQPYLWRILGWAQPGKGKTHFGYTMPQPVCIIDTEGKAHNLASKFEDKVTYIWQPDDYDEARDALDEAIEVLRKYLDKGHRGTIVVDSMSEMWEWSKQKYVSKAYQGKTLDEVNLSSNMGRSKESDWKVIKRYHNKRFREVMIDTPFHLYWTAMETDDYEAIMEGEDGNPKKPVGERDNTYKVDQVLRFVEGADGEPVGQLQKNGLSKFSYTGLRYPTFDKHQQVCEEIRDLEESGKDPMLESVMDGYVSVVEGNPGRWTDD